MSNMAKTSHFFLYHCHLHNVSKLTCYAARRNIVRNVVLRYSCYMWHTSCYATLATCGTRRVTLLLLHVAHVVLRYSCYMWHTSCVTLLLLHVAHVVLRYSCYMWHTSCYATLVTCGTRRVTLLLLHVAHVVLRYSCYMWHTSCYATLVTHPLINHG